MPEENQEAVVAWVRSNGGHLLTVSGAMASDRYDRPSSTLTKATGVIERPRARQMNTAHQGHMVKDWPTLVHNASGALGQIHAYIVRSHFTKVGPSSTTLATFEGDNTPAVIRTPVGRGQVTQFGFMPATPFPFMDAYDPSPDFNRKIVDGSMPYLLDFLDQAGASPSVNITEAGNKTNVVHRVETPLLVSDAGAVLTILNWQTRTASSSQPPLNLHISLQVELKARATLVDSVAQGKSISFTCIPINGDARSRMSSFLIGFDITMETLADFVRIMI